MDQLYFRNIMSLIQKPLSATIEVVYSKARKNDMRIENQKTCHLIINIIKHVFQKRGIILHEITVPINKPANTDIYFEVSIPKSEIDSMKKEILDRCGDSLKSADVFLDI